MLVYTKSCVAVPSFLFTIGTVTGVIVMFLTFLRLTGFLLAFYISLEHGLHEGHVPIAPRFLVGLFGLGAVFIKKYSNYRTNKKKVPRGFSQNRS